MQNLKLESKQKGKSMAMDILHAFNIIQLHSHPTIAGSSEAVLLLPTVQDGHLKAGWTFQSIAPGSAGGVDKSRSHLRPSGTMRCANPETICSQGTVTFHPVHLGCRAPVSVCVQCDVSL